MGFFKGLFVSLIVFAVLVTFLGPIVYYPAFYSLYGFEWIFEQISAAINLWYIDWIFDLIAKIFEVLGSVFKWLYYNWGLFSWLNIII